MDDAPSVRLRSVEDPQIPVGEGYGSKDHRVDSIIAEDHSVMVLLIYDPVDRGTKDRERVRVLDALGSEGSPIGQR